MAFIRTVPLEEATGVLRQFYDQDLAANGYVANTSQAFSLRPEVFAAIVSLRRAITGNMDLRRYELITLTVASRLRCTY